MRKTMIVAFMLGTSGFLSTAATAETVRLQGTYTRSELRSACSNAGGSFFANLNGHHCTKECTSNGQQGVCSVSCNTEGTCTGSTPGRTMRQSLLNLDSLLGSGGGGMTLSR